MAATNPVSRLHLRATSLADDLAFVAMGDIWSIIGKRPEAINARQIGGHMVSLHVHRWGLDLFRDSLDVDLGLPRVVAKDPWIVEQLLDLGYSRRGGNTFIRVVSDIPITLLSDMAIKPEAAIDILIAPYTSRIRDNVRLGEHLTTTEVPGLADAMRRPSVNIEITLTRLNREECTTIVSLPDETSTLILKALAWRKLARDTDAIDLWRTLEIAVAAGVGPEELAEGQGPEAARIIQGAFGIKPGPAMEKLAEARGLSPEAARRLHTRIRALIQRLFWEPAAPA